MMSYLWRMRKRAIEADIPPCRLAVRPRVLSYLNRYWESRGHWRGSCNSTHIWTLKPSFPVSKVREKEGSASRLRLGHHFLSVVYEAPHFTEKVKIIVLKLNVTHLVL